MPEKKDETKALIQAAKEARRFAHPTYSGFEVGAALQTKDGRIFTGTNVESSSYGLSICAERVAVFKALSEGANEFARLVVFTDADPPASPCGACRQLLWDYARGIEIILVGNRGEPVVISLDELFPRPFGEDDL